MLHYIFSETEWWTICWCWCSIHISICCDNVECGSA